MSTITIKCPSCGKILKLNDAPGIDNKTVTCLNCGSKHRIGDCPRVVLQPKPAASAGEETRIGPIGRQTSGDETQIGVSQQVKIGSLFDNFGTEYKLSLGVNTIGRMANSSPATVQIKTEDRTMSRSHAIIEVRNAGGQILHIAKNGANKNPSFLNGALIAQSDQLILNNGDRLKFGATELIFKK